ncbi:MAG: SEL1-like repeat protein [Peptoniphilaceae bacterium]|nr:SEL1-like repeat protein [Peptoniphilaceae bacterium]MDY6085728.1 SEL1-like repeat protein [Peptoniphilaceae bacterium]
MIRYAFPQIIHDACLFGVQPVLMEAISQTYNDAMDVNAAAADIERIFAHRATPTPPIALTPVGVDLSGFAFEDVIYLLFRQEYTGYDYDPEAPLGMLPLLRDAYELDDGDVAALWMSLHIYKTTVDALTDAGDAHSVGAPTASAEAESSNMASDETLAAETPDALDAPPEVRAPEEEAFSTWTDERALDLLKAAIAPYGDDVDAFFAPFTTALEVQTDIVRADQGDADSMIELAYDLILGKGVEVDYEQAQRWAEMAATSDTNRAAEAAVMAEFLGLLRDHEA